MEIHVNKPPNRRRANQIRLLEKQLRPEILERCLQFLDIVINQIIYQENIYPSNLFEPIQMYHSLVYQCKDKEISSYITLCVASLRELLSQHLTDMISINIIRQCRIPIILRRYLIELHLIQDPCLRAVYDNTKQLINQLEQIFVQCIQTIQKIQPLDNQHLNKGWTFQLRTSTNGRNSKGITVGEILHQKPIYKEFVLLNQQSDLLSNGKQSMISSIKSLHSERLHLQFMCEDDHYEQNKFQQWNQMISKDQQQDSDTDTDTDIEDLDQQQQENDDSTSVFSLTRHSSNDSELWPLTSVNNPPLGTIDEEETEIDSNFLIDRYHLTQKINRNYSDESDQDDDEDF